MKMMPQQYCLRWKHHHSNVQNMFAQLLEKERFCDVTLYCSPSFSTQVPNKDTVEPENIRGVSLRAHRVVLAACSELLGALLGAHDSLGEPVLVIDGAEPRHLRALLDYMYTGEMSVHHSQLASLLKTAEELRIKGLTDIRWNNKDEPPDCNAGGIITTTTEKTSPQRTSPEPKLASESKMAAENKMATENKMAATEQKVPDPRVENQELCPELRAYMKKEDSDSEGRQEKFNVNGGPPPLIKLPTKEKGNVIKRENSDTDTSSPKRQRLTSGAEHTDDDNTYQSKMDREEWHHGNLDISAERVVNWGPPSLGSCSNAGGDAECGGDDAASGGWSRGGGSDEEWGEPPADIGCFLRTRLRVDGDNSGDEESNEDSNPLPLPLPVATALLSTTGPQSSEMKIDLPAVKASTAKSGPVDPRFSDVVKLNDYLQHGRRPQFWEENYVRRVMEAVRLKELEMKQAAEILGVSYGTLYGRYRDVYGCINRPYRTARDFWQAKGPSEVLERFQRGEISLDSAAHALGVSPNNLSAYVTDVTTEKEFEPIPIEVDPSLKMKPRPYPAHPAPPAPNKNRFKGLPADKQIRKIMVGSLEDEDPIPATVITTHDSKATFTSGTATTTSAGKWPSIRVAQLDTLRSDAPTSPSQLMRTRPDLTIVAAKRSDKRDDDTT